MGYFTYRLFKGIPLDAVITKAKDNIALYAFNSIGSKVRLTGFTGLDCSALLLSPHEECVLTPIGYQLNCIWMDVRFQDGDAWDLTIYEGTNHRVSHSVNPWAFHDHIDYKQEQIDFRINRVCELWPKQGKLLQPYLLPWRIPVKFLGFTYLKHREGKAHKEDKYNYGDADQIHDFVRRFGFNLAKSDIEIPPIAEQGAGANG